MLKDLHYFMREETKQEPIISVPGVDSIKNENGEIIPFEIKLLSRKSIDDIQSKYRTRKIALDSKGNPYFAGNEILYQSEYDAERSYRQIVVEALQYPNLRDPELMSFYGCYDVTEMPLLVFSKKGEYEKVSNIIFDMIARNYTNTDEDIKDAKN